MSAPPPRNFWYEAFAIQGSITPLVILHVVLFGILATVVCLVVNYCEQVFETNIAIEVHPFEIAGAALGLLLVLRTNAGNDRWWEARKLWGGIVNQSRNTAISAVTYGPKDPEWRRSYVTWAAAFPYVAMNSLRSEDPPEEVRELVGEEAFQGLLKSNHRPSHVAWQMAKLLKEATDRDELSMFGFLQIDKERATLIDHIGGCERILKTPLPLVYSIKIRRFIAIFLFLLPLALLDRVSTTWAVPIITMFVAYPLMSLDQIGIELQNPFYARNLSHLPLDTISSTIETNLKGLVSEVEEETEEKSRAIAG
ncbi:bestrophin family protein [Calycomorphotria hydatis]|uniref:Bestrophin, RFP-TM, chloride channel n=1 Tax=Calycomorphotria hydatis TaxID=2528027 RepID=A0A517TF68_9PLAN|nr:bestrophin family ion channel [Calycomorphotria hydatis]QDT67007.1 Bestrophin, RFP-TM, chloride channel [Calycomorphotria hydatis]